jgi:hypothetical protein
MYLQIYTGELPVLVLTNNRDNFIARNSIPAGHRIEIFTQINVVDYFMQ